jgi:hypothetical protein
MRLEKGKAPAADRTANERQGFSNDDAELLAHPTQTKQCTNGGLAQRCRNSECNTPHHGQFTPPSLRHYCRNPKCRSKLPKPVENAHRAFCTRGCHQGFYRRRCAVCERKLPPGPANRLLCRRTPCKAEFRRFPHLYIWQAGSLPQTVKRPPKTSIKPGIKNGLKRDRAAPDVPPSSRGIRGPSWVLEIECAGFLIDWPRRKAEAAP